jgi:AmmeMemoRadiSam system protein A
VTPGLDAKERRCLLRLARAALEESFRRDGSLDRALAAARPTPALQAARGVFVTLRRRSSRALRGCIGNMQDPRPLHRSVIDLARKAAFEDPRFEPLAEDELSDLRLEVSALTPLRPIAKAEEIEIGRHGVELARGAARAVFLPQVATDHGWTVEMLLRQLALKAGLPADGWRDAALSVFEAEVFADPA